MSTVNLQNNTLRKCVVFGEEEGAWFARAYVFGTETRRRSENFQINGVAVDFCVYI